MKRRFLFLLFVLALMFSLIACQLVTEGIGLNIIRGSGNVVSEDREIGDFSRVDFASYGQVNIEIGEEASLRIEAEDNLLEYIITEVQGDTLTIRHRSRTNLNATEPIRYYLVVPSLEGVSVSGAGDVNAAELEADEFEAQISGAGDINFAGLTVEDLDVSISGLGSLTIEGGQVTMQRVSISGSGDYNAREVESERADIQISGLGSATVRVSEQLDAQISGAGSVRYLGDPEVESDVSGLGDVEKIEE